MRFARVAPLLLITAACVSQTDSVVSVEPSAPADLAKSSPTPAPTAKDVPVDLVVPGKITFDGQITQGGWIRGKVPEGTQSLELNGEPVAVAANGEFFAAFDRDAPTTARLVAKFPEKLVTQIAFEVAPRDWDIERVNVARRAGGASESFMQRRRPELAAIWDARQQRTGAEGWRQDFIWPVTGRISGRFGSQRIYRGEPGSYHSGLDIAGGAGTTYVAPADGIVTLAERDFSLEGQLLIIDHGQGLNSAFLHSSELLVRDGQAVKQGQPLGRIGASGRATGPHLHWSIKWKDARLDPLLFLPPM